MMTEERNDRTVRLIGEEAFCRLRDARVLVVGVGGVGGYAAEMLARTGVGNLTLVDADEVAESNLNRQIIALKTTVGRPKTELFAERLRDINPDIRLTAIHDFLSPENVGEILAPRFDYVIDAIDTVAPKTALIARCMEIRIPIISSMGAGGRIDPTKVVYTDLWSTRDDGLAKAVRQRLKKADMRRPLKVVASTEPPRAVSLIELGQRNKRSSYGTIASIPSIFGIYLANHVILKLSGIK